MPLSNKTMSTIAKQAEQVVLQDMALFRQACMDAMQYEPRTFAEYIAQYVEGKSTARESIGGLKQAVVRIYRYHAVEKAANPRPGLGD